MISRRELLKGICSSTILGPLAVATAGCGESEDSYVFTSSAGEAPSNRRPNVLLVLCDQLRLPPSNMAANQAEVPALREIMGFRPQLTPDNPYVPLFQGFTRLRQNAVVLRNHYIASAACSPSRTCIMTGQYPSLHGVTQVDGAFKDASEIQFLDPEGVPTVGDWFEAAGYHAYYMGKWHVSHVEPPYDLTPWGFRGYESSGPEPHGSNPDNLGTFRDPGFGDIVTSFLNERDPNSEQPWFAVASFVNPHDIVAYPAPFYGPETARTVATTPEPPITNPQPIPGPGEDSKPSSSGEVLDLNPDGFLQESFRVPAGLEEDMSSKPECQFDYGYKMQLALRSLFPRPAGAALPFPFQHQDEQYEAWVERYGQFYVYLQYLVDLEIRRVMDTLDAKGLTENTIVVFTSDHGEYLCSHNTMIEKWHAAYEEVTHVPFVVSSPRVNASAQQLRELFLPTSHIDLTPTLLGLAGIRGSELEVAAEKLRATHTQVRDLVGEDLTASLLGQGGLERPGVLFTTDDRITELPDGIAEPLKQEQYDRFLQDVEVVRLRGVELAPGPVVQPNSVRSFADGTWKLNRYLDPRGNEADQWEMYHLPSDPNEFHNLLDFRTSELRTGVSAPAGIGEVDLAAKRRELMAALAAEEERLLLLPS